MEFLNRLDQIYQEIKDKNHKFTRAQFADMAGASYDQMTGWYRGRNPDIEMLKKIARNFHVSVSWLVGETDIRYEAAKELQALSEGLSHEDMLLVQHFIDYLNYSKTNKLLIPDKK